MSSKADDIFAYIQERCLWQFASRSWDREANITGILGKAADLFAGREVAPATPDDKLFLADAKILVKDCRDRYSWIANTDPTEFPAVLEEVKDLLVDVAITKSKNRELNHTLY